MCICVIFLVLLIGSATTSRHELLYARVLRELAACSSWTLAPQGDSIVGLISGFTFSGFKFKKTRSTKSQCEHNLTGEYIT